MAYLAVNAHQSFAEMSRMSAYEIETFVKHVSIVFEIQNEKTDDAVRRSGEE